jgi:Flp pilus assembly protein TadG
VSTGSRGQALVEFALVAPLFLLLLFGIVEASLMMNAQATLDNATREGVRAAALCGSRLNTWTYQGSQYAAGGAAPSPCQVAATDVVTGNLGILPADSSVAYNVAVNAPASNTPGSCGSLYCAPPGTVIEVTVNYPYNFYFGTLFGQSSPVVFMSSSARAVSQQ